MPTGFVRVGIEDTLEAVLPVRVEGFNGASLALEAIVDTGFSGMLSLSRTLIQTLGLPLFGVGETTLADGTQQEIRLFTGVLLWDDVQTLVVIAEGGPETLIGMTAFADSDFL